jgi:uncharacterized membrane-anchored protein YjiN (DUF445 family)
VSEEKRNLYRRKVDLTHKQEAKGNLIKTRKALAYNKLRMKQNAIKPGDNAFLDKITTDRTKEYNKALDRKKRLDRTEKMYDKFNTKLDAYRNKQEAIKKAATKASRIKGGLVGAAAMAGYEVGSALNKKYNISGKIVDKLLPSKNPNEKANTDIKGKSTRIDMTPKPKKTVTPRKKPVTKKSK